MPPVQLIADIEAGTLIRSLLVAVVIVLPYGWFKLSRVRAARAAAGLTGTGTDPTPPPVDPRGLERVVTAIAELAGRGGEVEVPDSCTVDGQPVERAFAEVLVRDALVRSGLREVARRRGADSTTIRLEPADPAPGSATPS